MSLTESKTRNYPCMSPVKYFADNFSSALFLLQQRQGVDLEAFPFNDTLFGIVKPVKKLYLGMLPL